MNDLPVVVPRVMVAKQAVDADLTLSALMSDLPVVVLRHGGRRPTIHVFVGAISKDVDADRRRHDGEGTNHESELPGRRRHVE
jgi:hypothetical protein